jgi:hypothetical protein
MTSATQSPTRSGMAALARRYDAAVATSSTRVARPAVDGVAPDQAVLPPAAYSANAAVSRTPDEARGSLVDLLA